jgi:ABC-type sugar transport system substrate-binding protein
MKRIAKILGLLLISGFFFPLPGYSNGNQQDGVAGPEKAAFDNFKRPLIVQNNKVTIIYMASNLTDESNIRPERQAEIEAAHRGWKYQVINYENPDNFREYFQNAINQRPTAIIVGITQAFPSYEDQVKQARDAGIGIYSVDNSVIPGVISNSTMDSRNASLKIMEKVAADHPGKVLNTCVFTLAMSEVLTTRYNTVMDYIKTHGDQFKYLETLDLASTGDLSTSGYTLTQTWLQKFGSQLNFIFCGADPAAMSAAEAVIQAGDSKGEKLFLSGVDGGSAPWKYIRSGGPFKYTYSQPFEFFTHNTFEIIEQIQVKGLNPGETGCLIKKAGDTINAEGIVTTAMNVPPLGASIHTVFDYYGQDPKDQNAWYNWKEGPGIYTVTE